MASPHATGVAALVVSRFGIKDPATRAASGSPRGRRSSSSTESAAEHACPRPAPPRYAQEGRPAEFDALCEGTTEFNGFYGYGIVDAYAAVTESSSSPTSARFRSPAPSEAGADHRPGLWRSSGTR